MIDNKIKWIFSLRDEVPMFLDKLQGNKMPGFYHYSLSGDYFGEQIKWGLGNSVFFLKIVYTLGLEDKYRKEIKDSINFIKSFQKKDGSFYDPLVSLLATPFIVYKNIKSLNFKTISGKMTRRAETRQSFSSLFLFGAKTKYSYDKNIPQNKEEIDKYLSGLNWTMPWGAGSHFSHLLFFLNISSINNKEELIKYTIDWVNKLQHTEDGFWYTGNPDISQRINGAMKIITGLRAVGRADFKYAEKLINNCLLAKNDKHACDNFNIVYVLKYANEVLGGAHRLDEIKDFMLKRLDIYREYYHPEAGGFSFNKKRPKKAYFNAIINKGKNEPDIHGTVLFLWGVSLIAQVLDIDDNLAFKEFIT